MNPKLSWPAVVVLAALALVDAIALTGDLPIAEFAGVANALTTVF